MKKVLLIDSGSGGVNVLKECVEIVPSCNYLLFCDDKNLPYGKKCVEVLEEITLANLRNIQKFFAFDIVIFACNTLSCTVLERCRTEFPDVTFIGTVPAVKPALERFDAKDVLVLATEATLKHNFLINQNPELVLKAMPNLATEIDANLDNLESLFESLKKELSEFHPEAVVLGCTHYFAISNFFPKIFDGVEVFESANGVARRLLHFVGEDEKKCQVQIISSGDSDLLGKFWWHYLNS